MHLHMHTHRLCATALLNLVIIFKVVADDPVATIGCGAETATLIPASTGALCGSGHKPSISVTTTGLVPQLGWSLIGDETVSATLQGQGGARATCPTTCGTSSKSTTGAICWNWSYNDTQAGNTDNMLHTTRVEIVGSIWKTGDTFKSVLCSGSCTGFKELQC